MAERFSYPVVWIRSFEQAVQAAARAVVSVTKNLSGADFRVRCEDVKEGFGDRR
jgi:hypothetical protein